MYRIQHTGYLDLEDVDHPKRPPNDKIQTNHRTDPIFGMDGPQRSSTGPTEAIFGFRPLSRIIGIGLRYPQVKKSGIFLDFSSIIRLRGRNPQIALVGPTVDLWGPSMPKMGSVR